MIFKKLDLMNIYFNFSIKLSFKFWDPKTIKIVKNIIVLKKYLWKKNYNDNGTKVIAYFVE